MSLTGMSRKLTTTEDAIACEWISTRWSRDTGHNFSNWPPLYITYNYILIIWPRAYLNSFGWSIQRTRQRRRVVCSERRGNGSRATSQRNEPPGLTSPRRTRQLTQTESRLISDRLHNDGRYATRRLFVLRQTRRLVGTIAGQTGWMTRCLARGNSCPSAVTIIIGQWPVGRANMHNGRATCSLENVFVNMFLRADSVCNVYSSALFDKSHVHIFWKKLMLCSFQPWLKLCSATCYPAMLVAPFSG